MEHLTRIVFIFEKSIPIWLSVWAIRYRAALDYKLGVQAKALRWAVVFGGYASAAELPWSGARLVCGFVAITFLCWPNFAYHLARRLFSWPITRARVVSIVSEGDECEVSYSFQHAGETFGGMGKVPSKLHGDEYVTIAYDPLNPERSSWVKPERGQ